MYLYIKVASYITAICHQLPFWLIKERQYLCLFIGTFNVAEYLESALSALIWTYDLVTAKLPELLWSKWEHIILRVHRVHPTMSLWVCGKKPQNMLHFKSITCISSMRTTTQLLFSSHFSFAHSDGHTWLHLAIFFPQLIALMSSWPSTEVIQQCVCVLPYKAFIPRHLGNAVTKERSVWPWERKEGGTWMWNVEDTECVYFPCAFFFSSSLCHQFPHLPRLVCSCSFWELHYTFKSFPVFHRVSAVVILTVGPEKANMRSHKCKNPFYTKQREQNFIYIILFPKIMLPPWYESKWG